MLSQRIADQTHRFCNGRANDVIAWLQRLGCQCHSLETDCWTIKGIAGITVGLSVKTDPINVAVSLGMILAGMFWPQAFPDLLELVDKKWKQQRKEAAR